GDHKKTRNQRQTTQRELGSCIFASNPWNLDAFALGILFFRYPPIFARMYSEMPSHFALSRVLILLGACALDAPARSQTNAPTYDANAEVGWHHRRIPSGAHAGSIVLLQTGLNYLN